MEPHSPTRYAQGGHHHHQQQPQAGAQPPLAYEQSAALTFHNVDYLLHASVRYAPTQHSVPNSPNATGSVPPSPSPSGGGASMPILIIEAEQRSNGARWTGEFSAKYVEEMSLKTGNFKKFTLFIKMLSSAFSKSSEHVFIDLLTFEDLEALKVRKLQASGQPLPPQNPQKQQMAQAQNKRYLILTYVVEFDKVHYPLPLKFEMDPNPAALKQTIARLRSELDLARSNANHPTIQQATIEKYKAELYRLAEENHRLKSQLALRQTSAIEEKTPSIPSTSQEAAAIITPLELESLHTELRSLRSQLDTKQQEYSDVLRQMQGLMAGMPVEQLGLQTSLDNLSKQVWNLQSELRVEQQLHAKAKIKNEKEQEVLMTELERRLEAERLLRTKCRRLQEELDDARALLERRGPSVRSSGLRNSGSTDSLGGRGSSLRGPAIRRPLSATSPSPMRASAAPGRNSRPGSRTNSRPSSAASSRSNSPAPHAHSSARERERERERERDTDSSSRRGRSTSTDRGRSRSPSPSLSNGGRFDPSAYVKHKAEQLAAAQKRVAMSQQSMRASAGAGRQSNSARSPARGGGDRGYSPSRSASRSASNASLIHSPSSARSGSKKTGSPMPPRAPRPGNAKPNAKAEVVSPKETKEGRIESEEEEEKGRRKRKEKDYTDSEDDRRDNRERSDHNRSSKDNESIDQRFSALQNFLKQQKVDS